MKLYREKVEIKFLPDVYVSAQNYASMDSAFLMRRKIGVALTGNSVNSASRQMSVTVAADLSSLKLAALSFQGVDSV